MHGCEKSLRQSWGCSHDISGCFCLRLDGWFPSLAYPVTLSRYALIFLVVRDSCRIKVIDSTSPVGLNAESAGLLEYPSGNASIRGASTLCRSPRPALGDEIDVYQSRQLVLTRFRGHLNLTRRGVHDAKNKMLHKLSLLWPRNVSQEPPDPALPWLSILRLPRCAACSPITWVGATIRRRQTGTPRSTQANNRDNQVKKQGNQVAYYRLIVVIGSNMMRL